PMCARSGAGPCMERTEEGRRLRVAEIGRDVRDALPRLFQAREGELAPQPRLDLAEARAFLAQAPMQRTRREVQAAGDGVEVGRIRERGSEPIAYRARHLPVAAIEHRDLSGRAFEERIDVAGIAADRKVEQVRVERGHEGFGSEYGALRVDERVV